LRKSVSGFAVTTCGRTMSMLRKSVSGFAITTCDKTRR
jgi:hypothetical protein